MRDLHHNILEKVAIAPVSLGATAGGGKVSKIIDRTGFNALEFIFAYGSVTATNATVGITVKDGDATGTLSTVTSALLPGISSAGVAAGTPRASGGNKNFTTRVGYFGIRRYVQVTMAPTVSGGIIASAVAVLGLPRVGPTATP